MRRIPCWAEDVSHVARNGNSLNHALSRVQDSQRKFAGGNSAAETERVRERERGRDRERERERERERDREGVIRHGDGICGSASFS